jgi:hypothetical protein
MEEEGTDAEGGSARECRNSAAGSRIPPGCGEYAKVRIVRILQRCEKYDSAHRVVGRRNLQRCGQVRKVRKGAEKYDSAYSAAVRSPPTCGKYKFRISTAGSRSL